MTKKQAKKLCLEVWEYLRDHPEIKHKIGLPKNIRKKIVNCYASCPLCDIYEQCPDCPLGDWCDDFWKWQRARTEKTRAKYAGLIVDKVKAWKV